MATILLVDDEPTIRILVRAALEGTEHSVLEAADGIAALEIARRELPDLALVDIALPGLSGLELCSRLKSDPKTAAMSVFIVTGLVQQSEREAAEAAGANGFIAKPFSPIALVARIEETLRQHNPVAIP